MKFVNSDIFFRGVIELSTVKDMGKGGVKQRKKVVTSFKEGMAIRVVEFSNGGYKIRKIFA